MSVLILGIIKKEHTKNYTQSNKEMEYKLIRTCKDCKNVDVTILTKIESAFELCDSSAIWKSPRSKCSSTNFESAGSQTPKLDKEIFSYLRKRP